MFDNRATIVNETTAPRSAVNLRPSRQRAKRTNNPLHGLDRTSALGRRVADLTKAFLAAFGNPIDIQRQAQIIAAAELVALAEEARAVALRDPAKADFGAIGRLQGASDRAVRRLELKPYQAAERPSLRERLAAEADEAEAVEAASAAEAGA